MKDIQDCPIKFKVSALNNKYFTEYPYTVFINPKQYKNGVPAFTYTCKHMITEDWIRDYFLYSTELKAAFAAIDRINKTMAVEIEKASLIQHDPF